MEAEKQVNAAKDSGGKERKTHAHERCVKSTDVRNIHTKRVVRSTGTKKVVRSIYTKEATRALTPKGQQVIHTKGALPQGVTGARLTQGGHREHSQRCQEAVEKSCYIDGYMNT